MHAACCFSCLQLATLPQVQCLFSQTPGMLEMPTRRSAMHGAVCSLPPLSETMFQACPGPVPVTGSGMGVGFLSCSPSLNVWYLLPHTGSWEMHSACCCHAMPGSWAWGIRQQKVTTEKTCLKMSFMLQAVRNVFVGREKAPPLKSKDLAWGSSLQIGFCLLEKKGLPRAQVAAQREVPSLPMEDMPGKKKKNVKSTYSIHA